MSRTSGDAHCTRLAYRVPDRRTVAQIQRSAVEPKNRNPISRIFNAKRDKATIAAWRSDLDRILHVFEVRSTIHSLPILLTVHLQTELALHTHMAVSSTHGLVSDIHRAVVKGQEEINIRNQAVGCHYALVIIQNPLQLPRLEPGLLFQLKS